MYYQAILIFTDTSHAKLDQLHQHVRPEPCINIICNIWR